MALVSVNGYIISCMFPKEFSTGLVQDSTGNDLTYRIIGAAMAVHNALGPGYREEVYERALNAELQKRGIQSQCQFPVEVWHADARKTENH